MKQYKYSRFSAFIYITVLILFVLAVIFCLYFSSIKDYRKLQHGIGFVVFVFSSLPYLFKQFKQKVLVSDNHIYFENFYCNGKLGNFDVYYGTIKSISIKNTLSLKPKSLKLVVNKRQKPIFINSALENHKEMFVEICKKAKLINSDVVIDEKLIKYLGKLADDIGA